MSEPLPPIRLRSVTIKDFRGIDELTIKMPPDDEERAGALVIAGDNGVGKTSVLEAILVLLGRVDLLPADTASPSELVRQGTSDFEIVGNFSRANRFQHWTVNRAELEKLGRSLTEQSTTAFWGLPYSKNRLEETLRNLQWHGPLLSDFAVESFSARREPEDLGGAIADARGVRSLREERRLAELKRRLANVFARSGARNETFVRIESFMRVFMGDRWSLDVVFRSEDLGSEPVVVVRDGDLPSASLSLDAIRQRAAKGEAMPKVIPIDRLSAGQMALLAMTYPFVFGVRLFWCNGAPQTLRRARLA